MRRARVLIVDDDQEFRKAAFRYLQEVAGYECIAAASGAEAINLTLQRSPDAILLDLVLGDINGFDVFRALRSDPRTRTIPTLLITGRSGADLLSSAGKCSGAFELLRKPIDLSKLAATLRAALDSRARESNEGKPDVVKSGPLRIDLSCRRVYVNETPLRLGRSRLEILFALARTRDGVPLNILHAIVWGMKNVAPNTLVQTVSRLREDIVLSCGQDRIVSIPGGYKLL
jgi:DNA-binding response OmpR family regulator